MTDVGEYSPDIVSEIIINDIVTLNASPVLSMMSVLKMIPRDSPELTTQNDTTVVRKYIEIVR